MKHVTVLSLIVIMAMGCTAESGLHVSRLTYHSVRKHSTAVGPSQYLLFGLIKNQDMEYLEHSIPYMLRGNNGSISIANSKSKLVSKSFYFRGYVNRADFHKACGFVDFDPSVRIVFTLSNGKYTKIRAKLIPAPPMMYSVGDKLSDEFHAVW